MSKLKTVEEKIQRIERFAKIAFTKNGVDVRSDQEGIPQYNFSAAAQGNWTVAEWKSKRFSQQYSGYDVKVFNNDGTIAAGNRTLANVRGETC